jgi:outer membrane murein-binding lipoprotein Lpp
MGGLRLLLGALCVGSVFATGCLTGSWLVRRGVENAARATIDHFADEVSVLSGRVAEMEVVCH